MALAHRVSQFRTPQRARWMRALNGVGQLTPSLMTPDAAAWWRAARNAEKGKETPAANKALTALCESLDQDASLNFLGRIAARDDSLRLARTHLRVESALCEPEIDDSDDAKLPPTVFVVGWPRTGTTALHTLLAADPRNRTMPYWESFDPVPPPSGTPDRRPERVARLLTTLARFAPDYQAIHPMAADGAEECVALFMNHFRTLQFDIQYRLPGYVRWLLSQDTRIAYRAYRRQLALIHHHRPADERFVLKDPTHLVHLETILELFPDAKIIFTHRDPGTSLSSICSLYAHTRAIFSDDVSAAAIGREVLDGYWPRALDTAMALRERIPKGRFADLRHPDLLRDPIAALRKLYGALDLPFDARTQTSLEEFLEQRAGDVKHVHEHSLTGFGLNQDEIDERFAGYRDRFDIAS